MKSSEITDLGILYLFEQKASLLCYLPITETPGAGKAGSLSISIHPRQRFLIFIFARPVLS